MTWEEVGYLVGFPVGVALGVTVVILIVRWAKKSKKGAGK
jgi:hypothetical protein